MTLMFPKPAKPIRGTREAKAHMALVAQLDCVVCGRIPVQVHHVIHDRGSQSRASDFDTIPLCPPHHAELHASPAMWRDLNGPDHGFLPLVRHQIKALQRSTL